VGRVRAALGVRAGGHSDRRLRDPGDRRFLRNDFAFNAVADTSSRTTPTFYKAAAVWSSQEGSLLLWAWLMSLWSSLALFLTRRRIRDVAAYATAIMLGFGGFFIALMVFLRTAVRDHQPHPERRCRPRPAAALPDDDDPPPDALLGLHALHDPLAFGWGAAGAEGRRGVDQGGSAGSRSAPGSSSASASSWARAGPIRSSAGAATGAGTRSRTPRCCRG